MDGIPATEDGFRKGDMQFVTLLLDRQLCGIDVASAREVLTELPIARVPLAPPDILGCLNLRGRVVTAIDVRRRMGLPASPPGARRMAVVTEWRNELYALVADEITDVMRLPAEGLERCPPTLAASWREYCAGVHRLPDRLLAVLDVRRLLAPPGSGG